MIEAMFEDARHIAAVGGAPPVKTRSKPSVSEPEKGLAPTGSRSIREVYSLYLADPRHARCHRTLESYLTTGRWIEGFFGA
jgi:hypothetical protein